MPWDTLYDELGLWEYHWKSSLESTVRSIYRWLRTHLAVSGEGCVPREELQQAGHGVQVLLALPALPRLATRVRVGTVL